MFVAKRTAKPPYQLFRLNKTSRLDFWIKSNTKTNDPYASSTPPGKVPGMKVFLMNVSARAAAWRLLAPWVLRARLM